MSFSRGSEFVSVDEILMLYTPYHEMDIRQFCDRMSHIYSVSSPHTNLKRKRFSAGLSRSQLAALTVIPVRTVLHYERGQKDINRPLLNMYLHCTVFSAVLRAGCRKRSCAGNLCRQALRNNAERYPHENTYQCLPNGCSVYGAQPSV